jgi:hypothetical protein
MLAQFAPGASLMVMRTYRADPLQEYACVWALLVLVERSTLEIQVVLYTLIRTFKVILAQHTDNLPGAVPGQR